jgi:hypothetical protein
MVARTFPLQLRANKAHLALMTKFPRGGAGLILPQSLPLFGRDTPEATPREVGVFVTVEDVFPGTKADEHTLIALLECLSRDDTLFHAASVNTLITGPGDYDVKGRQQAALATYCTPEQIERINNFARRHQSSGPPVIFFAGQMRELMRWTARYAKNLPGDGNTFEDPAVRERFVKAALIASTLWSNRIYGDKLSAEVEVPKERLGALGALRKGIEETNLGLHLGIAIGRGIALFTRYLPKHYASFADEFVGKTGLTIHQYLGCLAALATYAQQHSTTGPLFVSQTIAAQTGYREIFPRYIGAELVDQLRDRRIPRLARAAHHDRRGWPRHDP